MDGLLDVRAFALGMIALLNPCGFALFPAYLGFFLGSEAAAGGDGDQAGGRGRLGSTVLALNRAQIVGLSMSAGFMAVFGLLGLVLAGSLQTLNETGWLPRITALIGVALLGLGVAMMAGYQPKLTTPRLNKGAGSRSVVSMFLFGMSYAVASLACTIGIFAVAVGTSASGQSFTQRFGSFLSYAAGMGLLATGLTIAVGFGQTRLVNKFRAATAHVNRVSAVILVIVGVYLILYGVWSHQVLNNPGTEPTAWIDAIVSTAEGWQGSLAGWLNGQVDLFGLLSKPARRTSILGVLFLAVNLAIAAAALIVRLGGRGSSSDSSRPDLVEAS